MQIAMLYENISIVRPHELTGGTPQTAGSDRLEALSSKTESPSGMWGGLFFVEPKAETGIHHHGMQETIVYVLEGQALIRWGQRGEHEASVEPGDFVRIPPFVPHREINSSSSATFCWVVVRSTPDPIVVNLPDEYWR
jgi:uncharacterized RmlC-like cupin family protein